MKETIDDRDIPVLRITMEQADCLIEVNVPVAALPGILDMKEYMRNTGADMYARLLHMMEMQKRRDGNE